MNHRLLRPNTEGLWRGSGAHDQAPAALYHPIVGCACAADPVVLYGVVVRTFGRWGFSDDACGIAVNHITPRLF